MELRRGSHIVHWPSHGGVEASAVGGVCMVQPTTRCVVGLGACKRLITLRSKSLVSSCSKLRYMEPAIWTGAASLVGHTTLIVRGGEERRGVRSRTMEEGGRVARLPAAFGSRAVEPLVAVELRGVRGDGMAVY